MSDLSGPHGPDDPYGKIRVSEIQKDAHKEDPFQKIPSQQKSSAGFLKIVRTLQKFLHLFQKKSEQDTQRTQEAIFLDIKKFSESLNELKMQDLSSDNDYLTRLSTCWHQFLRDAEHNKEQTSLYEKMIKLKDSINHYKANQDFSLGHYLNESAGHDWIPFPCVEILKSLFLEHQHSPEKSHLKKWTDLLSEISI